MSSKRYIEFSSTFRNRNLYPNPAEFIVKVNDTNEICVCSDAYNPISDSYPIFNFQSPDLTLAGGTAIFAGGCLTGGGNEKYPLLTPIDNTVISGTLSRTYDLRTADKSGFYNGMYLVDLSTGSTSSLVGNYNVSQEGNNPCLDYKMKASLRSDLSNAFSSIDNYQLSNSNNNGAGVNTIASIRIQGGPNIEGFYTGCYLEIINIPFLDVSGDRVPLSERFRLIETYNESTLIATMKHWNIGNTPLTNEIEFDIPAVSSGGLQNNFNNYFRIRKSLPCVMGWGPLTSTFAPIDSDTGVIQGDFHPNGLSGTYLYNQAGICEAKIVSSTGNWNIGDIFPLPTVPLAPSFKVTEVDSNGNIVDFIIEDPGNINFSINQQETLISGGNTATIVICQIGQVFDLTAAITNTNFVSGNLSNISDTYNEHIFFLPGVDSGPENTVTLAALNYPQYFGQYPRKLQRKTGDVEFSSPPFSNNLTGTACIKKYIVNSSATAAFVILPTGSFIGNIPDFPGIAIDWEILPYTRDSSSSMNYTGSLVSQQNPVCYNLNLKNLILPNITLKSPVGGLISFYPYVYVEISNVSAASKGTDRGVIYSNNPNAVTATFKAPISDVPTPFISKYIKLSSPMTQTLKFKPNDNLYFRVFFSDGETFSTVVVDTAPPTIPDPLLQISALLEIERL
jgi:hypothetical protein